MVLQRHEQLFVAPCKHVCPHIFLNSNIEVSVPVKMHHGWSVVEDFLVETLLWVCHLDTFGCALTLLDSRAQEALCDAGNTRIFTLLFRTASKLMTIEIKSKEKSMRNTLGQ